MVVPLRRFSKLIVHHYIRTRNVHFFPKNLVSVCVYFLHGYWPKEEIVSKIYPTPESIIMVAALTSDDLIWIAGNISKIS